MKSVASIKPGTVSGKRGLGLFISNWIQHAFPRQDPDFVMVTTRTRNYSGAPSLKPRSKKVRFVDTQSQPRTYDPPTEDDGKDPMSWEN